MTQAELAQGQHTRPRLTFESAGDGATALFRFMRPEDGWIAFSLLAVNLIVVVWAVDRAEWVSTPTLVWVLLLAMLTGLVLARLPVWGGLVLPVGLAVGILVVVWQLTNFSGGPDAVSDVGQLWDRLHLWFSAAKTGAINIDQVPFAFGVMAASWLTGYLAAWMFARYRNFWGVFILGATGLLSNLTYLPPDASLFLGMFLFTALLLVARVQSVRRRQNWIRRRIKFDAHLGALSASDSFFLALVVLVVAFLIPVGGQAGPAHGAYEFIRSPLDGWEDDFNRLFAGLPARRPIGYRIWGDVMAFQGTIQPTTFQVLRVESPTPLYWKARSYGTYTSKGWVSQGTTFKPLDRVPSHAAPVPIFDRVEVSYSVTPGYASRSVFAGDRVLAVDRDVLVETHESPIYALNIEDPASSQGFPPLLANTAQRLNQIIRQRGPLVEDNALAVALPRDLHLVEVERVDGEAKSVIVAEALTGQADVLSLRSPKGSIGSGKTYRIISSVSVATPQQLGEAGTDYPPWALWRYTQLPGDLPQRVRDLGIRITADVDSPYDKAKAIEAYLSTFPYTLTVDPPSHNADGVDHFLFTLQRGYSEYFASSMTVLLRSVGVPARLAAGYTAGDKLKGQDVYLVTDSHSHAWVEVYFPRYGWISFEPTPGAALPLGPLADVTERAVVAGGAGEDRFELSCVVEFEYCEEDEGESPTADSTVSSGQISHRLLGVLPWLLGALGAIGVGAGAGAFLWRRYMSPTENPRAAYRRLAFLASLGSLGPENHHTPYQYRDRLWAALPGYQDEVATLIDTYVRSEYGAKILAANERQGLVAAWLRLRTPLLLRVFRWRLP